MIEENGKGIPQRFVYVSKTHQSTIMMGSFVAHTHIAFITEAMQKPIRRFHYQGTAQVVTFIEFS